VSAKLADEATIDAWRQWVHEWDATPGSHVIRVRAYDADGELQSAAVRPPAPDGSEGIHAVTVRVD
jgi:hypothetical protein